MCNAIIIWLNRMLLVLPIINSSCSRPHPMNPKPTVKTNACDSKGHPQLWRQARDLLWSFNGWTHVHHFYCIRKGSVFYWSSASVYSLHGKIPSSVIERAIHFEISAWSTIQSILSTISLNVYICQFNYQLIKYIDPPSVVK